MQIDPPVQSPDVQDEVEQSDNPGTDQSTDTEPAGDTLADTSDDSAAQDSDSVSAIDEPASVLLVPNGQLDRKRPVINSLIRPVRRCWCRCQFLSWLIFQRDASTWVARWMSRREIQQKVRNSMFVLVIFASVATR